ARPLETEPVDRDALGTGGGLDVAQHEAPGERALDAADPDEALDVRRRAGERERRAALRSEEPERAACGGDRGEHAERGDDRERAHDLYAGRAHRSGPRLTCTRKLRSSSSSGTARSSRTGPSGDCQRPPRPAPVRASTDEPLNALPESTNAASPQRPFSGCSYSKLAVRSFAPPMIRPSSSAGPSDSNE